MVARLTPDGQLDHTFGATVSGMNYRLGYATVGFGAFYEGADAMVIVTEWNEFRMLDLPRARDLMAEPRMLDLRNIYKRDAVVAAGFQYWGVGR